MNPGKVPHVSKELEDTEAEQAPLKQLKDGIQSIANESHKRNKKMEMKN
jgi:hypothetical protein